MARLSTSLFLLAAAWVGDLGLGGAHAVSLSLAGQRHSAVSLGGLVPPQRRRDIIGIVDQRNAGDVQYFTNITLNGNQFRVLVDSGSADLWVAGDVPGAQGGPHNTTIKYSNGVVNGPIETATLGLGGFNIDNQSFVQQPVTGSFTEGSGVMGIGPSSLSWTLANLGSPSGNTVLDDLFGQFSSLPTFMTMILGRSSDPSAPVPGQLTIGEVISSFSDIQSSAQLSIERVNFNRYWMVALDLGGIIGPDATPIAASVDKQLKVVFDATHTLSQVPSEIADAIYSRVPGAKLANISASDSPVWIVPCSAEVNVTFNFAGIAYPAHPLETVTNEFLGPLDASGTPSCVGGFQPMPSQQPYDIVLGVTFLRTAYILMNFGNLVGGAQTQPAQPFVQLRALVTPAEAHDNFVQQRLDGVDTTGQQTLLPVPIKDQTVAVAQTAAQKIHPYLPEIIIASVLGGLLLLFAVAYFFIWRSGRKYRHLHDRAPAGLEAPAPDVSPALTAKTLYEDPYEDVPELPDPWASSPSALPEPGVEPPLRAQVGQERRPRPLPDPISYGATTATRVTDVFDVARGPRSPPSSPPPTVSSRGGSSMHGARPLLTSSSSSDREARYGLANMPMLSGVQSMVSVGAVVNTVRDAPGRPT
ncbi:aspartic peptidase domain-containing protein [Lenzites betulinus]|nr:aspartic peptidase domain-containing protein [Lenzites betulinus]